jgi:hypothetical protein
MGKNKTGNLFLPFIGGLAAGWIISLFMSTEIKTKSRKLIEADINKLRDLLQNSQEQDRIRTIFKEKTDQAATTYAQIKDKLIVSLANLKESLEEIDHKKYVHVVNQVLNDYQKQGQITGDQLKKLASYLESDYKLLKAKTAVLPVDIETKPKKISRAKKT